MNSTIFLETKPSKILLHFEEIVDLSNSEKSALGFIPSSALKYGIERGKMLALMEGLHSQSRLIAYLFFSGVFPNAKIQQIATINEYRRQGIATRLIGSLVSHLEKLEFLTIQADVASDLIVAKSFYSQNGFEPIKERPGGLSRKRTIIEYGRVLNTNTLFTRRDIDDHEFDFGIKERSLGVAPFFVLDLNVYFDLARNRSASENSRRIFGAALSHKIRIAVTDELVNELQRTTTSKDDDVLLQLAFRLPKVTKADPAKLIQVRDEVFSIVYSRKVMPSTRIEQAKSDAAHLAHAILARASGFVTEDKVVLASRDNLFNTFGIDVLPTSDLILVLPLREG